MDGRPLILLVEPNLHDLEILNFHLKALNFSCICAKQGVRALILAQTHKPDLILLDMMLTDLSSIQVIHYLKRNPETKTIPIIGVTSGNSVLECTPIHQIGAVDSITKPYDFHQIDLTIRRHITQLYSFK